MDKNIIVIEGEAEQIKVTATYENKDVSDHVTLDADASDFNGLITPSDMTHGVLPFIANDPGEKDCMAVFKYVGDTSKHGEGESFHTKKIKFKINPTVLSLIENSTTAFKWGEGGNKNLLLKISKNGKPLSLIDPKLKVVSKTGVIDIQRIEDSTVVFSLKQVAGLLIGKDFPPITDMLKLSYRNGTLELPINFHQEKTINFINNIDTTGLTFNSILPFSWLGATWKDGTNALPALAKAVPESNPYFKTNPDGSLQVMGDDFKNNISGLVNWTLTFIYEGLEWVYQTTMPFTILKSFSVGAVPTAITGKVGDKGVLVFNTKYRGTDNAEMYSLLASSLNTGNNVLKFGNIIKTDNKVGLPYEIVGVGKYTFAPSIIQILNPDNFPLLAPSISVATETNVVNINGTLSTPNLKLGSGGNGTISFKLVTDKGEPVIGASFSNITKEEGLLNVLNIGSNKPVETGSGNYTLSYTSALLGWIIVKMNVSYQGKTFPVSLPKLTVLL